jgi:hypothetical protein
MTKSDFVDGVLFSVSGDPLNCFIVNIRPESIHFHIRAYCKKCNTVGMHLAYGNKTSDLGIWFNIRVLHGDTEVYLTYESMNLIPKP